jgi:hypothetical protein
MDSWGICQQSFSDGNFGIDLDSMWKLLYDRRRIENYCQKYSKSVPVDTTWLGKWFGPHVNNIEIDWKGAAADAAAYADHTRADICYQLTAGGYTGAGLRQRLQTEYASLDIGRMAFTQTLHDNGRQNSEALKASDAHWDAAIKVAKGVRDASQTFVAVGATMVSGPAAMAIFTAVGSGMKGVGYAQDCKRQMTVSQAVGTAVVAGSLDFVASLVTGGIGEKLKPLGKALINFYVNAQTKTATSVFAAEISLKKDERADEVAKEAALDALKDVTADAIAEYGVGKLFEIPEVRAQVRKMAVATAGNIGRSTREIRPIAKAIMAYREESVKGKVAEDIKSGIESLSKENSKRPVSESLARQPVHGGSALMEPVLRSIVWQI